MNKPSSRHGRRAENKTQTSISLRLDLLTAAQNAATAEGRTFSNWLEQLLKEMFPNVGAAPVKSKANARPSTKAKGKR
jgi:hypothetical protein